MYFNSFLIKRQYSPQKNPLIHSNHINALIRGISEDTNASTSASSLAQELLFAYVQVYFFTNLTDWGIDDREIIAAEEFGKSKEDRKRVIRELMQNGWTTVIKKRPKKRCLSQQGKKQLNLQAIFQ